MIRARLNLGGRSEVEAAAEGLVRVNLDQMRRRVFPPLYSSGIRYKVEKGEEWKPAAALYASKVGDCEDLSAYRAAELRFTGEDPRAKVMVYRSAPRTFHAVVERGDGSIEDPSLALGMKPPRARGKLSGFPAWTSTTPKVPAARTTPPATPPATAPPKGWMPPWAAAPQGAFPYAAYMNPQMMPATANTMPGGVNPWLALAQLQSGQNLGLQAQLAQLQNGMYQARLTAPGTPTIQTTAATPQEAGGGAMGKLAMIASDPALQGQMGGYGPAIAAGAQGAALLADDPQVKKAMAGAGRDIKRASRSIKNSKPVKALAKLFGIK